MFDGRKIHRILNTPEDAIASSKTERLLANGRRINPVYGVAQQK
jgi:hypothetical protein